MARRLLTAERNARSRAYSALAIAVGLLGACRKHSAPQAGISPAASGSAAPSAFADEARATHFEAEKKRATERWASKPSVDDCSKVLHEDGDAALCQSAATALTSIEQLDASAGTDRILQVLADGSLALARLSQRARYQALADMGQNRTTGDAGAPAVTGPTSRKHVPAAKPEQHSLELTDSPATRFMSVALRLERDGLRNLGAYLEYAPLPVRRSAFETVKKLRDTRPQWPLLEHTVHEASLLESDPDLKHALSELAASGLPRGRHFQPADSK